MNITQKITERKLRLRAMDLAAKVVGNVGLTQFRVAYKYILEQIRTDLADESPPAEEEKGHKVTMKEMCETIVKADLLVNADGTKPTALEIFSYSPNGELYPIFFWYQESLEILRRRKGLTKAFLGEQYYCNWD